MIGAVTHSEGEMMQNQKAGIGRTLLAELSRGTAMNAAMLLTSRLLGFGWNGGGFLVNPELQSPKLIAVWTQLKPLPLVADKPAPIIVGLVLFAVTHAFPYRWQLDRRMTANNPLPHPAITFALTSNHCDV